VFHLIPLSAVITLLSSWMYLTKCIAVTPSETATIQKKQSKKKLEITKRVQFKQLKRFTDPIMRLLRHLMLGLRRIGFATKAYFERLGNILGINRVSSLFSRSHFARAAIKGSAAILSLFMFSVFLLYVIGRPTFLYELGSQFYWDNPHFQWFILGIHEAAQLFAQSLSYIGLSSFLNSLIAPLAKTMVELDVLWKYLLCQNVAAYVSALLVLFYGRLPH